MTEEEKRRRLRRVYALLTRLADEKEGTPDTETLTGTRAGVATSATDKAEAQYHYSIMEQERQTDETNTDDIKTFV